MTPTGISVLIVFLLIGAGLAAWPFLPPRKAVPIRIHWLSFVLGAGAAAAVIAAAIVLMNPQPRVDTPRAMPPDAMIAALQTAAQQDPRDAQPLLLLGRAHFMRAEYGASIAAYSKILATDPDHIQALAELGLVFYDRGLFDVAYKTAERALSLDRDNLSALWISGQVLTGRGEDRAAIEVWQRFLRVSPPGPQAVQAARYIEEARARLRTP